MVISNLHQVVFNAIKKTFYAVGDNTQLICSSDGINWESHVPLNPMVNLYTIMVVNGNLVIAGQNGNIFEISFGARGYETIIARSQTVKNIISSAYDGTANMLLAGDDGTVISKPYIYWYEANWSTPQKITSSSSINGLIYDSIDNLFLGVNGNGEYFSSEAGNEWIKPIKASNSGLNAVTLDPQSNFIIANTQGSKIVSSYDLNTWLASDTSIGSSLNDVKCFDSGLCLSVGNTGSILTSAHSIDTSLPPVWSIQNEIINNEKANLSDAHKEDLPYLNDTLVNVPVGSKGLKTYIVTNTTFNHLALTIQSISSDIDNSITIDPTRSTCYYGAKSAATAIKTLQHGESCSLVYQYNPITYGVSNKFNTFFTFTDQNGSPITSSVVETYYSSRAKI